MLPLSLVSRNFVSTGSESARVFRGPSQLRFSQSLGWNGSSSLWRPGLSRDGQVWPDHRTPPSFTSLRGEVVWLYHSLYRKSQATRMVQLVTSRDPGVRKVAELHLKEERREQRSKYRPAQLVQDLLPAVQFQSRQAVARAVKTIIAEEEEDRRHHDLCQLPLQGEMARLWGEKSPVLWVKAVQGLPPEPLKFALNASLNTLPTNANLHTWGRKSKDTCTRSIVSLCLISLTTVKWRWTFEGTVRGMTMSSRSSEGSLSNPCHHTTP